MKKTLLCALIALGAGFVLSPVSLVQAKDKSEKKDKSVKKLKKKSAKLDLESKADKIKQDKKRGKLQLSIEAQRAAQMLDDLPSMTSGPFEVRRRRSTQAPEYGGPKTTETLAGILSRPSGAMFDRGPESSGKGGSVLSDISSIAGSAAKMMSGGMGLPF